MTVTDPPAVLAVVGTRRFADPRAWPAAEALIGALYYGFRNDINAAGGQVISGGAEGIDTLAEHRAAEFGWTVDNGKFGKRLPELHRWEPRGYKARNLLIAQTCTHLVRIACPQTRTRGSRWTADRAAELGRDVRRYVWAADLGTFTEEGRPRP